MSWFSSNTVTIDAQIERATDESIPFGETDLAASLEITDLIRSKQVQPKDAMRSLKKRLNSTKNPNTQLSTLHLIDTCVKNGGNHFIVEISSREFIDSIVSKIHDDKTNENVRDLSLDLIQNWAIAFKDNFQFKYVVSTYEHLKSDGYNFPPIGSEISSKFFDSSAPPEWEDSDACMICSSLFSMLNRKHHCRNCGGVFCQTHSSKSLPLPHLGITDPVRVCDTCYDELSSKSKSHKSKKHRRSKHQKEVSRARAQYDSDDDEDLKKALELSLRESQGYTQVPIPVIPPPRQGSSKAPTGSNNVPVGDEDDEDMKAAIAASLKGLEDKKAQLSQPPADNSPYANLLPQSSLPYQPSSSSYNQNASVPTTPVATRTNFISSKEEADIRQFASKVDYHKFNPSASNDPSELHELYRKAVPLTPKLSTDLNESIDKYDKLVDMNSKIDTVMRLYNKMLDERIERETSYQRQQQYAPPPQQSYQNVGYQQYAPPPPAQQNQQPQEPSSPVSSYYRPASQIPDHNSLPQQPYQHRQSSSSQSPIVASQQPHLQQPQYSGGYVNYPSQPQQQQPQQQSYQENPPAYSNGSAEYSYAEPQQLANNEEAFKGEQPPVVEAENEEEGEEEDEYTAPPAVSQPNEQQEQNFYEPAPQHVIHPEFSGEPQTQLQSSNSYKSPSAAALSYPPQTNINPPQQGYTYPAQQSYQYQLPQPKVTDVTFPTVPMNKPPQGINQVVQQPEEREPVKEEQLIEL